MKNGFLTRIEVRKKMLWKIGNAVNLPRTKLLQKVIQLTSSREDYF